jgi:hypothetical protein
MNKPVLSIAITLIMILASPTVLYAGKFQPYEIKAGVSYYSDEYTTHDDISELGEERNFEEVYQNYNYYEAIFDSQERIVIFNAYEKGTIVFSESYSYDSDGHPIRKVVKNPDGSTSVLEF